VNKQVPLTFTEFNLIPKYFRGVSQPIATRKIQPQFFRFPIISNLFTAIFPATTREKQLSNTFPEERFPG
jgi:hypothetical protein